MIKAALLLLKNKKVLAALVIAIAILFYVLISLPSMIVQFVFNTVAMGGDEKQVIKSYKEFGDQYHADWSDVLIFDYVRSEMELEKVDKEESLDWFTFYEVERTTIIYEEEDSNTSSPIDPAGILHQKPGVLTPVKDRKIREVKTEIVKSFKGTEARVIAFSLVSPKPFSPLRLSQQQIESTLSSRYVGENERLIRRSVGIETAMDDYGFTADQREWVETLQINFREQFAELFDSSPDSIPIAPDGFFMWPVPDLPDVSSRFGWRILDGQPNYHPGVDLNALGESDYGKPVYAPAEGEVAQVHNQDDNACGLYVRIKHQDGWQTRYCHLSAIVVQEGQKVNKGGKIALVGNSGNVISHLHFEMKKDGGLVDPLPYIWNSRPGVGS